MRASVSKTAAKQLAALPRQRPAPFTGEQPVTVAELRALTRSDILRNNRLRLNAIQHRQSAGADNLAAMKEGSPETWEVVANMQRLVKLLGGEWAAGERP